MSRPLSHSISLDPEKVRLLRQALGWTQEYAAEKSGYSSRLIRKVEAGGSVRPGTLVDVLQCYHDAIGTEHWSVGEFLSSERSDGYSDIGSDSQLGESRKQDEQRDILRMQEWYITTYNNREISRVAEFIAPDTKYRHAQGQVHVGIDAIREIATAVLTGFDPLTFEFPHSFFYDGYIHTFWKLKMRHVGLFGEVPATGKWITCRGNSRVKLVDGKMVDAEDNWDVYDVLRRLQGESPKWF